MKKTAGVMINDLIRGAACALLAATALSCGKENIESEVPEVTEPQEEKVVTFTGRFAEDPSDDTKIGLDYDKTNKKVAVSFTGGESIKTYAAGSGSDNEIKASDINADGSVNFSIGFESSSDPYCFFVTDKNITSTFGALWNGSPGPVMYSRSDGYNSIAAGRIPHLAWGKCNPGETNVTFHNILCLLRYTTTTEEADHVEFCGNDGETLIGSLGINYSTGKVSLNTQGVSAYTSVSSNIAGAGKDNYIALMPGVTLSKGFLIKVYDKDGNELYICRDNSSFSTTAGKIIDLGTLENHKASQYNLWLSGYDIEINGVKYNKETYGDATLVKKGTTFGGNPGVYFINGEATMGTIYGSNGNVIVCSNSASSRAKINFSNNTELVACKLVAFKGLDIESPSSGYALASSGTTEHLTFDNCKLTLHSNLMDLSGTSAIEHNIEMADCDVITDITAGSNCCLFYTGTKQDQFTISSLSFKNNIFWSKYPSVVFSILTTDGTVAGLAANNVYLENNTFYNVDSGSHSAGYAKSKPFIMLGAVKETCSLKANLAYSEYGVNAGSTSRTAYLLGCYSKDYAAQYDITSLLAETPTWYGYSSTLGGLCIYTDSDGNLNCLQTGMTSLTTDPYYTIDPTTGSYSKKASFAGYGAER
jgi:hypothetical protein